MQEGNINPLSPHINRGTNVHCRFLFLIGTLIIVLFHLQTLFAPHREGDELVYLSLARNMTWDFNNYTTKDEPGVSDFAQKMYRAPVFIHPPLYPYIIKILGLVGNPVLMGLLLGLFAHVCLFLSLLWLALQLRFDGLGLVFTALFVVFCPIINFSTTRIHIDGLLSLFGVLSVMALIRAMDHLDFRSALLAGVLGGLTLNTKYSGIFFMPVYLGVCLLALLRKKSNERPAFRYVLSYIAVLGIVGLPHYLRILWQYGSLYPMRLLEFEFHPNPFQELILKRSRIRMATNLLMIYPIFGLMLFPAFWKWQWRVFKERNETAVFSLAFIALFLPAMVLIFRSENYWAPFLPFFYLVFGSFFKGVNKQIREVMLLLAVCTVFLCVTTTFLNVSVFVENAKVVPSLILFLPPLRQLYY